MKSIPSIPPAGTIMFSSGIDCCTSTSTIRSSSFSSRSSVRSFSRVRSWRCFSDSSPSEPDGLTSPREETTNARGVSPLDDAAAGAAPSDSFTGGSSRSSSRSSARCSATSCTSSSRSLRTMLMAMSTRSRIIDSTSRPT
ncbi:MAG TPA: hypothetical protein VFZ18_01735 [Longimicrobiaceae bacterium]